MNKNKILYLKVFLLSVSILCFEIIPTAVMDTLKYQRYNYPKPFIRNKRGAYIIEMIEYGKGER